MRRVIAFLYVLMVGQQLIMSQTAEREVLSNTGGSYTGNIAVDWTLGQVVIQQGGSSNTIFTQGFQQPIIVQSTKSYKPVMNGPILLMPNPSEGDAVLNWSTMTKDASVVVYNASGACVYEALWQTGQSFTLPGKTWIPGVYQVAVLCEGRNQLLKYVRF